MKIDLNEKAKELRRIIFKTIHTGGGGHIGASLSIVEILVVLYYGGFLKVDPKNPLEPDRDRFILSKGHACVSLYAVLADIGFFDKSHLSTFGSSNTILGGHPDMNIVPGVEATTGALGHGFPFGAGIAFAGKLDKKDYKVIVIIGDGECQEGSIWEAAFFAAQHKLDNLIVVIDNNKLQAMDSLNSIVSLEPFIDKWKACNWNVAEADGHDLLKLTEVFKAAMSPKGKPNLIVANTIKGKGISFMENEPIWHYRMPDDKQMEIAYKELGIENLD
tara:strand:- start:1736 stop:2560 length:825 start_codon:yes stop_codon:yes gene_type:complete